MSVISSLPLMSSLAKEGSPSSAIPKRLIFLSYGFGPAKAWYPEESGKNFKLTEAMTPLASQRNQFSVLSNLTNLKSVDANPHWGSTTFLTGADVLRIPGKEFQNDISCDQVAAEHIGRNVRFPSLVLSAPSSDVTGHGPGLSLSWDEKGNPITGTSSHAKLFSELFGDGGMSVSERQKSFNRKRSVMDMIYAESQQLKKNLSREDQLKLSQYHDLIDNIERKIKRQEEWISIPKPKTELQIPEGSFAGLKGIDLMFDLMVSALQTDSTRVITYRLPVQSVHNDFAALKGVKATGPHPMTHYGSEDTVAYEQLMWRDQKMCEAFSNLLKKLEQVKEVNGSSLLDNTYVVMGSSLRTGHRRKNLPILVGGGGSTIRHGSHYVYEEDKSSLCNLWYSLLNKVGCDVDSFNGSHEILSDLFVS